MIKVAELREKSHEDLVKLLGESQREIVEAKRSLAAGELANPRRITTLRRDIAKIKTIITEVTSKKENA